RISGQDYRLLRRVLALDLGTGGVQATRAEARSSLSRASSGGERPAAHRAEIMSHALVRSPAATDTPLIKEGIAAPLLSVLAVTLPVLATLVGDVEELGTA